MTKIVTVLLSLVIALCISVCGFAAPSYSQYERDAESAKQDIAEYEKICGELQTYLDAVESGDRTAWESARNLSAVRNAFIINSKDSEVDAVKSQLKMYSYLLNLEKSNFDVAQHKMDIYYHAFILQDFDDITAILSNGNRTVPEDTSENIYYEWPYVTMADELLTNEKVAVENAGNVYLCTASVVEIVEKDRYVVNIGGIDAMALVKGEQLHINETANLYFTPFGWNESRNMIVIMIGFDEEFIDFCHLNRYK